MKNKKVTYLLVVAVLAIWGTVAYKIIAGPGGGDEYTYGSMGYTAPVLESDMVPDSFQLSGDYRDPFLGKMAKHYKTQYSGGSSQGKSKTTKPPKKTNVELPAKNWSFIQLDPHSFGNHDLVHLSIHGMPHWLKEGETAGNVTIEKIFKEDSIQVSHEGVTHVIKVSNR